MVVAFFILALFFAKTDDAAFDLSLSLILAGFNRSDVGTSLASVKPAGKRQHWLSFF